MKIYREVFRQCHEPSVAHETCPRFVASMYGYGKYEAHCVCRCHGEMRLKSYYDWMDEVFEFVEAGKRDV